jgi:hypothetical protein
LLKESSTNFTKDEFKKVIEWIEDFDCKVDRPDDDDEAIKNCNAYYRKEWLLLSKSLVKNINCCSYSYCPEWLF